MKVFVQKSKYSTNLYFGQITKLILINLVNREHVKFDILPPCAAGVRLLGNCVCNFDYFLFKYLKIVLVRFISSVIVRNCDTKSFTSTADEYWPQIKLFSLLDF